MDLNGTSVIVTGGASGIGAGTARAVASLGQAAGSRLAIGGIGARRRRLTLERLEAAQQKKAKEDMDKAKVWFMEFDKSKNGFLLPEELAALLKHLSGREPGEALHLEAFALSKRRSRRVGPDRAFSGAAQQGAARLGAWGWQGGRSEGERAIKRAPPGGAGETHRDT